MVPVSRSSRVGQRASCLARRATAGPSAAGAHRLAGAGVLGAHPKARRGTFAQNVGGRRRGAQRRLDPSVRARAPRTLHGPGVLRHGPQRATGVRTRPPRRRPKRYAVYIGHAVSPASTRRHRGRGPPRAPPVAPYRRSLTTTTAGAASPAAIPAAFGLVPRAHSHSRNVEFYQRWRPPYRRAGPRPRASMRRRAEALRPRLATR